MDKKRPSHREWRRIAKKERRRKIRRKAAQERDADDKRLRETLERSADYLNWLAEEEKRAKEREEKEAADHAEQKRLWLEREVKAQQDWRELQARKAKARQEQLQQEEIIRKEFEAKQKALQEKQAELKRRQDEEIKRLEELEQEINDYIDHGSKTPEPLRQTIDSQPGKELCPFFSKTAACRYGDTCSRNHRRTALSSIILIPGFYSHFSLEKNSAEYDTDITLEFEASETRKHFQEFYRDIMVELETFGRIKTFRCCCNSEIHLRGNVYVEYASEREAARAWRRLKGRWYGGRQLNCEFANFKSWRNAVCGMAKCSKGRACNFLHTFRNPSDEYDIQSPPRWSKRSERESSSSRRSKLAAEESTRSLQRDWRWSESPEIETTPQKLTRDVKNRRRDEYKHSSRRSSASEDRSERSSMRKSSKRKKSRSRSRDSRRRKKI